ncbi:hypothetical protein ACFXJ8_05390 [Nonomuraea sp. NPDC059194]|uniref:hypothetical protein n=1 Tax=Nonomuraea sp. NPDC059194 TaxID=3346764 RepID=UPI003674A332
MLVENQAEAEAETAAALIGTVMIVGIAANRRVQLDLGFRLHQRPLILQSTLIVPPQAQERCYFSATSLSAQNDRCHS